MLSGIPGPTRQHFDVPYSLTEEFVAVYRMHPLVPDDYEFRSAGDDRLLAPLTLRDIAGPGALEVMGRLSHARPALQLRHHAPGACHAPQLPAWTCRPSSGRTGS